MVNPNHNPNQAAAGEGWAKETRLGLIKNFVCTTALIFAFVLTLQAVRTGPALALVGLRSPPGIFLRSELAPRCGLTARLATMRRVARRSMTRRGKPSPGPGPGLLSNRMMRGRV